MRRVALSVLVCLVALPLSATQIAAQQLGAPPLAAELARIDSLTTAQNVSAAVALAESIARRAPTDATALARLARVRLLQGDAAPEKSPQQDRLYRDALAISERAVAADPTLPEAYLRRAAAAGKVALFAGIFDASDYVQMLRSDTERIIAMRNVPPIILSTAHYILGRTHLKLTETPRMVRAPLGLAFGNRSDALMHLRQARTIRPGFIMIELEYGRALSEDGRAAEARTVLRAVAGLPEAEPGDAERKAEAATLLAALR